MIYFIPGSCTEADMIKHRGKRSSGGEKRDNINSQEQCVGECLGDANCRGVDWSSMGSQCIIHFDQSDFHSHNDDTYFNQHVKPSGCV